jgi:hypothetical protein
VSLPTDNEARKRLPILTFLTEYFPDAVLEMVKVSVAGNIQHNPELEPADIKWSRGKSTDQLNTAFRHLWDHKTGTVKDVDGQYHLAKTAWRVLAQLQLQIEADQAEADPATFETFGLINRSSPTFWKAGKVGDTVCLRDGKLWLVAEGDIGPFLAEYRHPTACMCGAQGDEAHGAYCPSFIPPSGQPAP